jgi:hypothetical protein
MYDTVDIELSTVKMKEVRRWCGLVHDLFGVIAHGPFD